MDYHKRSKSFINNVHSNSSRILKNKKNEKIDHYVLVFIVNTLIILVVDAKSTLHSIAGCRQNDTAGHHYQSV